MISEDKLKELVTNAERGVKELSDRYQALTDQLQKLLNNEQQVREAMAQTMNQLIAAQASLQAWKLAAGEPPTPPVPEAVKE